MWSRHCGNKQASVDEGATLMESQTTDAKLPAAEMDRPGDLSVTGYGSR